jgi:DNA (cytosine-5)-methyltransferase 1
MNVQSAALSGNSPTVISTFAGCGGSSLGYRMAGFREILAVEWDDNAVATFRLNFPGVPVYHGDIATLTGVECMRLAGGIKLGELDVLDGSPPCQGFSTAGKRGFDDPRNSLFREYARLLQELQPRVFVMENVTGMIKGYMKQAYLQITKTLRGCGYRVKGQVMNAMYYNVPQSRERVIVIGVREDLGIEPSHPRPQTKPKTAAQALSGVVNNPEEVAWLLDAGLKYAAYQSWLDMPVGTCLSDLGFSSGFNCCKLDPSKPARTIRKADGHIGMFGAMHWSERRRFTVAEFKRFSSFPDDFAFAGGYEAVERIGNSVPPNLMRAIAEHIKANILDATGKEPAKLA